MAELDPEEMRARRVAAGWTLAALAEQVGVQTTSISGWERGCTQCATPDDWEAAVEYAEAHPKETSYTFLATHDLCRPVDHEALRRRRIAAGWAQQDIAEWIGVKDTSISGWERGCTQCTIPDEWEAAVEYAEAHPKKASSALLVANSPRSAGRAANPQEMRARRVAAGWTLAAIAERVRVSGRTISSWELGQTQCTTPDDWEAAVEYAEAHPKETSYTFLVANNLRPPRPVDHEALRRRRIAAGWSQRDIATQAGVSRASIARWELCEKQCTIPDDWEAAVEYAEAHPKETRASFLASGNLRLRRPADHEGVAEANPKTETEDNEMTLKDQWHAGAWLEPAHAAAAAGIPTAQLDSFRGARRGIIDNRVVYKKASLSDSLQAAIETYNHEKAQEDALTNPEFDANEDTLITLADYFTQIPSALKAAGVRIGLLRKQIALDSDTNAQLEEELTQARARIAELEAGVQKQIEDHADRIAEFEQREREAEQGSCARIAELETELKFMTEQAEASEARLARVKSLIEG